MPKAQIIDEVEVLRFFEEAPMEKAETMFKIVSRKFRLRANTGATEDEPKTRRSSRLSATPGAPAVEENGKTH